MTSTSTDRRDGFNTSAAIKVPCRVATTTNITLSGYQTIDGVLPTSSDSEVQRRILVKNQTTGTENGVYIMDTGTWARAKDFDGTRDSTTGTLIPVNFGTVGQKTVWRLTTTGTIVFGTSSISFEPAALFTGTEVISVATKAALTALTGMVDGQVVDMRGYYTAGGGGGGSFWWDSASSATDNGGTVIAPDAGGTGRWRRVNAIVANVKEFGALETGDASARIQAAIDSGLDVDFVGGTYNASGLTQSTNLQVFRSTGGIARLVKNANGALFTSSGTDVQCHDINFRGDASSPVYTGDGAVFSGVNAALYNCGARWFSGRALKMTGSHSQVYGTCDIYQTTDATATGYDIEVGVSGTATFYHQLHGIYSSQATGGILLVDTGSHTILGGQFGKLFIDAGTSPSGVNGGMTIGARILGAVDVEMASAVFAGNQFGAVAITFASGTSGCRLDTSNVFASGATVTNSGNANNFIMREVSTGGTFDIRYGSDASLRLLKLNPSDASVAWEFDGSLVLPNTRALAIRDSVGTAQNAVTMSAANNLAFLNRHATAAAQYGTTGTGFAQFLINSAEKARLDGTAVAGNTALMLYDVDNNTVERVTVGAADSGGAGFKVLRIPN